MIKTNLRPRDFLALFSRPNPIVWFMAAYIGVCIIDAIFGTNLYAVVMTVAVFLGLFWVAATGDIELFNRARDCALGTRLLGKRDSRVTRALRRRSKKGQYTSVGFLTCRSQATGESRDLIISIDLSRHDDRGHCNEFGFVLSNGKNEVLYRGEAFIDHNGISQIEFPLDGVITKATLKVLGPSQYFTIDVPEFEEEGEVTPDPANPFMGIAADFLSKQSSSKEDVTSLRRKIAKEIHPDRGSPAERLLRSEALAWANGRLDRREARFA